MTKNPHIPFNDFDHTHYGGRFFNLTPDRKFLLPVFAYDAAWQLIYCEDGHQFGQPFHPNTTLLRFKENITYPQPWHWTHDDFMHHLKYAIQQAPEHFKDDLRSCYPGRAPKVSNLLYAPPPPEPINISEIMPIIEALDSKETPEDVFLQTETNLAAIGVYKMPSNIPANKYLHRTQNSRYDAKRQYKTLKHGWYSQSMILRKALIKLT